jgi:hypothetical protein
LSERPARYEGPGPNDETFDPKNHFWDGHEWWTADRLFWWDGAQWQLWDAPHTGPGPNDDTFDPKKHFWDGNEWWTADRLFWWDGARWQPWDAPHPSRLAAAGTQPAPRRAPRPPGYRRDFWFGFAGTVAVNIALFIIISTISAANYGQVGTVLGLVPWLVNIGGLILFAIIRPRVALGMLLAYGVAFALVLMAGIFFLVLCFGLTRGSSVP